MAATKTGRARRNQTNENAESQYRCADCGRTFERPQSLGAHRRQAHGVAGTSKRSQSRAAALSRQSGAASSDRSRRASAREGNRRANVESGRRERRDSPSNQPSVDRDALLKALFPSGIPARQDVLRDVTDWLDHAERLARSR